MADQLDLFVAAKSPAKPMVYAYEDKHYPGKLKVGYTAVDVDKRVAQQYPTLLPGGVPYNIVFRKSAIYEDGGVFTDHDLHRVLRKRGVPNEYGEWFTCGLDQLNAAYIALKYRQENDENRDWDFSLRPEQAEAVEKTALYYRSAIADLPGQAPKFLWNAKMRFGKTFAAYQLARKMGFKRVLVMTFKPAVESAWSEDIKRHKDFAGWQFISRPKSSLEPNMDAQYQQADKSRPIVCFGSFQDLLGENKQTGGIKVQNEWVHATNWDLVIFDEYHFGAWRDNAKKLFTQEDEDSFDTLDLEKYKKEEADNAYNETWLPITTNHYLYLSGTPFRALNTGEFLEEQIYSWTYSDEQQAKEAWADRPDSPYRALPRMVMLTYRMPEELRRVAEKGEFNEFDLNLFFKAEGHGKKAKFVYEDEVQKWLNLIRGAYLPASLDDMRLGGKPAMPFSDARLLSALNHTFWFLPDVASCEAMANLMAQRQNVFYHEYKINVCAGYGAGIGLQALGPVRKSMEEPLNSKSITLSCGKLTTGVTVKPWSGIFMLRNLQSPETYFQAAFRVQSPWEIETGDGVKEVIKHNCYVFDFALDRALRQIADYGTRLNINEPNREKAIGQFMNFLPVLAYDEGVMRSIDAGEVLDIALRGTSATMLAKRWESALLVNVDNDTLKKIIANQAAMDAIMRIEGFRSLGSGILETIINKSEGVKKAKKEKDTLTPKEKQELTQEEKEYKSLRKQVQEKLIKFATRIPIFMYLTDYREASLQDVITQLEPGLFKAVTGLDVKDFELLVSLNVFNAGLMGDAIFKFRRYEDSSLDYTGINLHQDERVGGWDSSLTREEFDRMFTQQQASMAAMEKVMEDLKNLPAAFAVDEEDDDADDEPQAPARQKPARGQKAVKEKSAFAGLIAKPAILTAVAEPAPWYGDHSAGHQAKPQPQKPVDWTRYAWVQPGAQAEHKKFGLGQVIRMESGRVEIAFAGGTKLLEFPGTFERGFLRKPGENWPEAEG